MLLQMGSGWSREIVEKFLMNYQHILYMLLLVAVLHLMPDNLADRVIFRFQRLPLLAYLAIFFAFVLVYGYFKSAEQVLPIYLQF
jgi:hypothetical protein